MAAKKTKNANECEVGGCKNEAKWTAHKLWGKGGAIRLCDECRPKPGSQPEGARQWYRVEPIEKG